MNEFKILLIKQEIITPLLIKEYKDKIQFLLQSGVFDLKRGSATINFDNMGNISSVEKKEFIYPQKGTA